jgi:hypothetical protein
MSFLKSFGDFVGNVGSKVIDIGKAAFSEGNISGDIVDKTNSVFGSIGQLGNIVAGNLPRIPNSVDDVEGFISDSSSFVKKAQKVTRDVIGPAINTVKLLAADKRNDRTAIDEVSNRYADIRVTRGVTKASEALDKIEEVFEDEEVAIIQEVEEELRPGSGVMSERNATALAEKIGSVLSSIDTLTPDSRVGLGGSVTIARPVTWLIDWSTHQMSAELSGNGGVANGLTVNTGTRVLSEISGTLTSVEDEAPFYDSIASNRVFRFQTSANPLFPYAQWPPKQDCYNWRVAVSFDFQLDDSGGGGDLAATLGVDAGRLVIFSGPAGGAKVQESSRTLNWGSEALYSSIFVMDLTVPDGNGAIDIDMVLYADNAVAVDFLIEVTDVRLIGFPKTDSCAITNVDYMSDSTRRYLTGTETWSSLFGKVSREYFGDPNFSMQALWNDRSARNFQKLIEIVDSIVTYSNETWGSLVTDPSVNDKYVDRGVASMVDAARLNAYLFTDGPFLGRSRSEISEIIEVLRQDLELARRSLLEDNRLSRSLATNNAFQTTNLITL